MANKGFYFILAVSLVLGMAFFVTQEGNPRFDIGVKLQYVDQSISRRNQIAKVIARLIFHAQLHSLDLRKLQVGQVPVVVTGQW